MALEAPTRWQFRPPWWATLGVLVLGAAMAAAGTWQLQRAQGKKALLENLLAAQTQPPAELAPDVQPPAEGFSPRRARGEYLPGRELLLDNQTVRKRPGRRVWTPLRLESGALVLVDRGWIALAGAPSPPPAGPQAVEGYWRALPMPGMRLDGGNCRGGDWPRVVQYPDAADLACLYPGERVVPGVLLLDRRAPGGFVREWDLVATDVPPARHYAYAAQWFAFTLTLVALYLKLNLKRRP